MRPSATNSCPEPFNSVLVFQSPKNNKVSITKSPCVTLRPTVRQAEKKNPCNNKPVRLLLASQTDTRAGVKVRAPVARFFPFLGTLQPDAQRRKGMAVPRSSLIERKRKKTIVCRRTISEHPACVTLHSEVRRLLPRRSSPQAVRLANFLVIFCLRPLAAVRIAFTSGLAACLPVQTRTDKNET